MAGHGWVRLGKGLEPAWWSNITQALNRAWLGLAGPGSAGLGGAGLGSAWLGVAGLVPAWQGLEPAPSFGMVRATKSASGVDTDLFRFRLK